jgi:hypothetical protein
MKESEIRPDKFRDQQKKVVKVDAGRLLSKYDEFIDVSCPACDSDTKKYHFTKYGLA